MQTKTLSALFGYGVIGKETARNFKFDVIVDWDKKKKNYKFIKGSLKKLKDCDEIWLCVPTPSDKRGGCDVSEVFKVAKFIKELNKDHAYFPALVVRSTVIPGTAEKLNKIGFDVISYPEFLRAKYAKKDMANPWGIVLGCNNPWLLNEIIDEYKYFRKHKKKIHAMDNISAEIAKYAHNTLFSTLVIFANQIYDVCEKTGGDYSSISPFLKALPWEIHSHLDVWHEGYRGASGHCLPKDLRAFNKEFQLPLLQMVEKLNLRYLKK